MAPLVPFCPMSHEAVEGPRHIHRFLFKSSPWPCAESRDLLFLSPIVSRPCFAEPSLLFYTHHRERANRTDVFAASVCHLFKLRIWYLQMAPVSLPAFCVLRNWESCSIPRTDHWVLVYIVRALFIDCLGLGQGAGGNGMEFALLLRRQRQVLGSRGETSTARYILNLYGCALVIVLLLDANGKAIARTQVRRSLSS